MALRAAAGLRCTISRLSRLRSLALTSTVRDSTTRQHPGGARCTGLGVPDRRREPAPRRSCDGGEAGAALSGSIRRRSAAAIVWLAFLLFTSACGGSGDGQTAPADSRRLFLLGLDAADQRLIASGIEAGRLPCFARMIREGAWGPLRTHRPILSPILWTTMATGLTPDRHGVLDFLSVDARGRAVPVTRAARRAPAFWNILGERGVSCGIVGWLATYPAETVNGFVVSDRFTVHPFSGANDTADPDPAGKTFPASLYGTLEGRIVEPSAIGDAGLADAFGAPAVAPGEDVAERRELRVIEADARSYAAVALALDHESRPALLAVYFEAIDRLMHLFGDAMPPRLPGVSASKEERYGRAVERFYATMDARLAKFLEAAGSGPGGATVIVVSDHGFTLGAERPRHPALRGDIFAAEWHRDPGVILAWGRGVRKGARIEGADIYDVAPTVLAYFGAPASEAMRGRALGGIFEPGFLPPSPPRVTEYAASGGAEGGPAASASAAGSVAEQKEILENLKALGYIGGGNDDPAARASANLATFYLEEKQYDRAIEIYTRILSKDPGDLIALYNVGLAYRSLGSPAKAAESFERLLRERADYVEARLVLSECYLSLGRAADALTLLLAKKVEESEDAAYQNHLGTALASVDRLEEAAAAFTRAIALRREEASPYLNLARVQLSRGDREGAIATLRRAVRDAPGDPRVASRLRELAGGSAATDPH